MSRIALVLVEGETEEEFYSLLIEKYCKSHPKKIKNLHGNFSINKKIVDAAIRYSNENPEREFDVYVCIDQERTDQPAYNHDYCTSELSKCHKCKGLFPVVAVLMCESLFFLDIHGIYKFLRARKSERKPDKFKNHRKLTHHDLSKLFRQFGKCYHKGKRCEYFVSNLDLEKLLKAAEIKQFIANLQASAKT